MNVLVSGGTGYLGSHLVAKLLDDGHRVTILGRFTGTSPKHPWLTSKRVTCIRCDIADEAALKNSYFDGIDWVFHMAGANPNPAYDSDPAHYYRVNVTGTVNMLAGSERSGVSKFIYPMTSAIYTDERKESLSETAFVTCHSVYAHSKFLGEQACLNWASEKGLGIISLRLFSVYGPDSPMMPYSNSVLATMIRAKKEDQIFYLDGDGSQCRDFVYISDVLTALVAAAQSSFSGEIYNVGSGVSTSLRDVARILGVRIAYSGNAPAKPFYNQANIRKITSALGWSPTTTLHDGIRTIA